MSNVAAIAKRELRAYFNSPIAYVVICVFLAVSGYFYWSSIFLVGRSTLRPFFGLAPWFLLFFAPAVTCTPVALMNCSDIRARACRFSWWTSCSDPPQI